MAPDGTALPQMEPYGTDGPMMAPDGPFNNLIDFHKFYDIFGLSNKISLITGRYPCDNSYQENI